MSGFDAGGFWGEFCKNEWVLFIQLSNEWSISSLCYWVNIFLLQVIFSVYCSSFIFSSWVIFYNFSYLFLKVSLIQYLHHVSTFVHVLFVFKNDKTWEMRGYCDISSVSVALVLMYAAFVIKRQLLTLWDVCQSHFRIFFKYIEI